MSKDQRQEEIDKGRPAEEVEGKPAEGSENDGAELEQQIMELSAQLDDAKNRELRLLADFQNYQRRSIMNEKTAKQDGVASVVRGVVGAIDNFDLALGQDMSKATVEQVMGGIRVIRDELLKAIQQAGVTVVSPAPNDEFKPGLHEAVTQMAQEGVDSGNVAMTFQAGYTLGERVIRPAKVAVAP